MSELQIGNHVQSGMKFPIVYIRAQGKHTRRESNNLSLLPHYHHVVNKLFDINLNLKVLCLDIHSPMFDILLSSVQGRKSNLQQSSGIFEASSRNNYHLQVICYLKE